MTDFDYDQQEELGRASDATLADAAAEAHAQDELEAALLGASINTCLNAVEEFIIDCAKRIDAGDGDYVGMANVSSALVALKLWEGDDE